LLKSDWHAEPFQRADTQEQTIRLTLVSCLSSKS